MAAALQSSHRRDIPVLPSRRLLAIDAGSHTLKLLLVEEIFGRLRVLRRETVERRGVGNAVEEEVLRHAQATVQQLGDNPIALALPHYRALSQVMDLPSAEARDVKAAIEEETVKLSGLGESPIVHDYSPMRAFGRHENPFWVTLCQEAEVQRQIQRCGLAHLDLCEVTTSANALVAAYLWLQPQPKQVVLVDVGAVGTLVSIVLGRQPVYVTTFPLGGDSLADAYATEQKCGVEEAERRFREVDVAREPEPAALGAAWRKWLGELRHVLQEWTRENATLGLTPESFDCVLCGGAALQPGLEAFLNRAGSLRFSGWPETDDSAFPGGRFAVAYGAALHALGRASQPASLLPDEVRLYWNRHHGLQVLYSLLFFLLLLLTLALGVSTWQKADLLADQEALEQLSRVALAEARTTELKSRRQIQDYEQVRPVLYRQRQTLDVLQTLALLQQTRSNQAFFYVLFADQQSYYAAKPPPATNVPAGTNAPPASNSPAPAVVAAASLPGPPPVIREGFVAELCLPEKGDAGRKILTQIVGALDQSPLFRNVDSLADDRRRFVVDPQVLLPEGHVALELEVAENPFRRLEPASERKAGVGPGVGGGAIVRPAPNGGARNGARVTP